MTLPPRSNAAQNLRQLRTHILGLVVQAVAVGRFDDKIVRLGDGQRIVQDRLVDITDVAGEHDLFLSAASRSQNSMQAEPSRWPISEKRTRNPSAIVTHSPYRQGRKHDAAPFASSTVYSGSTGGSPARSALRVFHAASDS